MIYGIEAQVPPTTGGATGALGELDFVNGVYNFDSAVFAAADVITNTAQITANGLEINAPTFPNAPSIIESSIKQYFDTGQFMVVIEFSANSNPGGYLLTIEEWFSGSHIYISWFAEANIFDANNLDGSREAKDTDNGFTSGLHKMAILRTDDLIAVSIDGFPNGDDGSFEDLHVALPDPRDDASDDEGHTTIPFTHFNNYHFGGVLTDGLNSPGDPQGSKVIIKKITFYNPVSADLLPSFSSP